MKKALKLFAVKNTRKELFEKKDIQEVYLFVKDQYVNSKNLDITLEKIYLQEKLSNSNNLNIFKNKFMLIFITVILTLIIEASFKIENGSLFIIYILFSLILLIFISIKNLSKIKQKVNERTYYKICLMALNEIEKSL
ncbi:hypothetical protein [uncultured Clostridium sp.]|uniref:hypothetical protein n=1 Tax=uncultured Clostridium sp. TaxID=59620 RepID=UPI0027315A24|nr:hypothetical protein [uncultured Clostridium sp.]